MNSLNRDGDWEQEFILRYGHCGGDKKRELERQNIINFIRTLLEEAKAEERKRCLEALPKPMKMKPAEDTGSEAGWGMVTGFNYCLDQAISAISNKK